MENYKINIKDYFESKVTFIIDKDKAVWFKGCDVATILGYENSREAMKKHIDMEDKKKMNALMPSRNGTPLNSQPHTTYINESGLYSLVFGSRMETAKEFKRWVPKKYYQVSEKLDLIQSRKKLMIHN
jgi:prophage antirepressor-like protein